MAEQIFNVTDFGAKGDGVSLDTSAIQAALDAAYQAGGGVVYLPAGVYIVNSSTGDASDGALQIRDNVTLRGDGMGVSSLKIMDGEDNKISGVVRTPAGEATENVVIENLTIDGNRDHSSGEIDGFFCGVEPGSSEYDQNILVQSVEIKNVSRYGFDPHEQTKNLTIRDSIAHDNTGDGFTIDFCSDTILENNVAYDNDRYGFNIVTSSHDVLLLNNDAYGNKEQGISIQKGSDDRPFIYDIKIQGGEIHDNAKYGIEIKLSEKVTVQDVDIHDNGSGGISIFGAQDNLIVDNHIYDNGGVGVRIHEYDDREGVQGTGELWASTGNTITGNTIEGHAIAVREDDDSSSGNASFGNIATGSTVGIGLLPLDDASGSTNLTYVGYLGDGPAEPGPGDLVSGYFEQVLRTDDLAAFHTIADQVTAGELSLADAIDRTVQLADGTTSVATLTYQFFTGHTPTQGGLDYLVSPTGPNPNNINAAYFQSFDIVNRYINFAVNVGAGGEGRPAFEAAYGALSLHDAAKMAYAEIFGAAPTDAKIDLLLEAHIFVGGQDMTRADYLAIYGGDGLEGLGTKAAVVGFLLAAAVTGDQGSYALSNDAYLADLADGGPYQVDLVGDYGDPSFVFHG